MNSALELDKQIKAEQAFYEAAREGKTLAEARVAAQDAVEAVQTAYVLSKAGVKL